MTERQSDEGPAAVVYRYRGNGDHAPGMPARDLTAADVATLDAAAIEASGLYEPAASPRSARNAKTNEPRDAAAEEA